MLVTDAKHDMWSEEDILPQRCPHCGAKAIVELTPRLKAKQPDGTTHVCHPGFGGCNLGFTIEPANSNTEKT